MLVVTAADGQSSINADEADGHEAVGEACRKRYNHPCYFAPVGQSEPQTFTFGSPRRQRFFLSRARAAVSFALSPGSVVIDRVLSRTNRSRSFLHETYDQTHSMTDKVVAPTPEDLERVEEFIREPVLLNGDDPKIALAAGTIRRRAFDDALAEIESGADEVSRDWARKYALALGLEREISVPEPKLVDGTTLNAHQVDVLSGTLAALMSDDETLDGGPYADGAEEFDEEDFEDDVEDSADEDDADDIDAGHRLGCLRGRRGRREGRHLRVRPDRRAQGRQSRLLRRRRLRRRRAASRAARRPVRRTPLLVRARDRRRQVRRRAGICRGLPHRRRPDPHPPPQPGRPVHRRARRPWLQGPPLAADARRPTAT